MRKKTIPLKNILSENQFFVTLGGGKIVNCKSTINNQQSTINNQQLTINN